MRKLVFLLFVCTSVWGADHPIIPQPANLKQLSGHFILNDEVKIVASEKSLAGQRAATYLQSFLAKSGLNLIGSTDELPGKTKRILFRKAALDKEAYRLTITPNSLTIEAADYGGFFYAIQSLIQLLPVEFHDAKASCEEAKIKCLRIEDKPRFAWRSMMLDCSRQFFSVEVLKKYIDTMALYKMNVFHWHLTDNEGWRLEIKKYPKLTELGAWRGANEILPPSRGSRKERYGGFYTQEQIKDLVAYALERNINILPEIDIPGHCMAIAGAYPEVLCLADESKLKGIPKDSMCAGRAENFQILDDIFTEVAELFPFDTIHVGGDEVKKQRWAICERCAVQMKQDGMTEVDQLQNMFVRRVEKIIASKGKKMLAWNEVLKGGKLNAETKIMSWEGIEPGVEAVKAGHGVVMSPGPYMYFDMAQKSRERGHSWAGFINTEKVYSYEPLQEMNLNKSQEKLIYGVGACLWAEYLDKKHYLWHQTYPRLLALAEVAWSPKNSKDWHSFQNKLMLKQFPLLAARGIKYRVPTPKLNWKKDLLTIIDLPKKAKVYYTLDGTQPTTQSMLYAQFIEVKNPMSFKAVLEDSAGRSSAVTKIIDQEEIHDKKSLKPKLSFSAKRVTRRQNPLTFAEDWDRGTYVWFETQCQEGEVLEYFFEKPLIASSIECRSGVPQTIRSVVEHGVLEGSVDGNKFFKLANFIDGDAKAGIRGKVLKKVRVRFLSEQSEWTALQDLIIYP